MYPRIRRAGFARSASFREVAGEIARQPSISQDDAAKTGTKPYSAKTGGPAPHEERDEASEGQSPQMEVWSGLKNRIEAEIARVEAWAKANPGKGLPISRAAFDEAQRQLAIAEKALARRGAKDKRRDKRE